MRPVLSLLRSLRGSREADPHAAAGEVVKAASPAYSVEELNPIPDLVQQFVADDHLIVQSPDRFYEYDIRPSSSHPYVQVSYRGTKWGVVACKAPIANGWRYVNDNGWRTFRATGPTGSQRHDTLCAVLGAIFGGIPLHSFRCGQHLSSAADYMATWGPGGTHPDTGDDVPF